MRPDPVRPDPVRPGHCGSPVVSRRARRQHGRAGPGGIGKRRTFVVSSCARSGRQVGGVDGAVTRSPRPAQLAGSLRHGSSTSCQRTEDSRSVVAPPSPRRIPTSTEVSTTIVTPDRRGADLLAAARRRPHRQGLDRPGHRRTSPALHVDHRATAASADRLHGIADQCGRRPTGPCRGRIQQRPLLLTGGDLCPRHGAELHLRAPHRPRAGAPSAARHRRAGPARSPSRRRARPRSARSTGPARCRPRRGRARRPGA